MNDSSVGLLISGDLLSHGSDLNGRRWVGQSWMRQWFKTSCSDSISILYPDPDSNSIPVITHQLRQLGWSGDIQFLNMIHPESCKHLDTLFVPDPSLARWSQFRQVLGPNCFSIVGQIHTINSAPSINLILDIITNPVYSWDALVCSSKAGRDVVLSLFDNFTESLSHRFGTDVGCINSNRPQLPIIPLPVDVDTLHALPDTPIARNKLGIPHDHSVVLWLGRLSFLTKYDPWPTYSVLERVAKQLPNPLTFIECGVDDTIHQANHFEKLRSLCPHVNFVRLGGDQPVSEEVKHLALAASDIAVSLVDNTQETFGLSIAESMSAGLPLVVSDWSGYRDLVQHGVHGFRVPTRWSSCSTAISFPLAWSYIWGLYDFPAYSGSLAQLLHVDLEAAASDILTLLSDPVLRTSMGKECQRFASLNLTGAVVMQKHRDLFNLLADRRLSLSRSGIVSSPSLLYDPVKCFSSFASPAFNTPHLIPTSQIPPVVSEARHPLWSILRKSCPSSSLESLANDIRFKHP